MGHTTNTAEVRCICGYPRLSISGESRSDPIVRVHTYKKRAVRLKSGGFVTCMVHEDIGPDEANDLLLELLSIPEFCLRAQF